MARLLTNHDPGHIHALLGSMVLLHFFYRTLLVILYGDAFPVGHYYVYSYDNSNTKSVPWEDIALVLLHALLPLASLVLPLPVTRNFNSPMIWPEGRLHSLVFGSRHVIATIFWLMVRHSAGGEQKRMTTMTTTGATTDGLLTMPLSQIGAILLLVHATMLAASKITSTLGDSERRTTNAMPYDPFVPVVQRTRAKRLYAFAQFQAAALMLAGDPTLAFVTLSGIQSAPFLMTLVRKGKCSAATYHCIYTWSLVFSLMVMLRMSMSMNMSMSMSLVDSNNGNNNNHGLAVSVTGLNAAICTGSLAFWLRTGPFKLPKHVVWIIAPLSALLLCRGLVSPNVAASHLVIPLVGLSTIGIPNLFIPTIMFHTTETMQPFVDKYGNLLVGLLYFGMTTTYIVNGFVAV